MKKICITCKRSLSKKEYTGKRNVCKRCLYLQRDDLRNASHKAYLAMIHSKLKTARKDMEWEITTGYLEELWDKQNGRCALSGVFMTWQSGEGRQDLNVSIDRKSPDKGYIIGNIQLVTQRVNIMKHILKDAELYWWCKNIVTNKEDAD
tara:strand:- start:5 stop:451 length:447 start_codon:yes stop_codon:yes gene_type:complete